MEQYGSASSTRPIAPAWDIRTALALIAVFFAAQTLFAVIAVVVLSVVSGVQMLTSEDQVGTLAVVVINMAAYLFSAATVLELTRHLALRLGWSSLREAVALRATRLWPAGIAAALVTAMASDGLSLLLGKPIVPPQDRPVFAEPVAGIVFGLFTVLVPPFTEEVVFRGALYSAVARIYGRIGGVLLSAVAFGLVHVFSYGFDWYVILLTTIMGIVLGVLRAYTGSLWPCVAAHATNNVYASLEGLLLPSMLGHWP